METTYLKVQEPNDFNKTVKDSLIKKMIINFLGKIIPKANPDFDGKIDEVKYWLIEFDLDGIPQREIGLDNHGKPIMKMPWNKNYGYWTDNNLKRDDFKKRFESIDINKSVFEDNWDVL